MASDNAYSAIMALDTIEGRYAQVMAARELIGSQDYIDYGNAIRPVIIDGCNLVKGTVTMSVSIGDDDMGFMAPIPMDMASFVRRVRDA